LFKIVIFVVVDGVFFVPMECSLLTVC